MYELESGGVGYGVNPRVARKQVIMGRGPQRGGRTMCSTLGLHSAENSNLDQVFKTGNIMKHEPLARLCLLLYFIIVHLWLFFHAVVRKGGACQVLKSDCLELAGQLHVPPSSLELN